MWYSSICFGSIEEYFLYIHIFPVEIRVAFLLLSWYNNKYVCGAAKRLIPQHISIIPRVV